MANDHATLAWLGDMDHSTEEVRITHATTHEPLADGDAVTFLPIGEGIWNHSIACRYCGLRGLVLREAERQGVTASQLTRAALEEAVGTKGGADRGAAVGDGGRERDAGIDSPPQSMV